MKKIIGLILMFFTMSVVQIALANEGANPLEMLKGVADKMIANLKANKATLKTNPNLVYTLAYKIVVPHADLDEMAKRVLPRQTWNSASQSQRSQFENEFTTLLVRTYASALADYSDQSVRFYPVRGGFQGKTNVKIDSQILRSDGPSLNMNYSLVRRGSEWKLYDMSVEGVSLLESFRAQFRAKLGQGNIADLIRDLKQHNSRLRSA